MNERRLGRFLKRLVLLTAPLPITVVGAACGGSAIIDQPGLVGASGEQNAGAGPSAAGTGVDDSNAGSSTGGSAGGTGGVGCSGVLTDPMTYCAPLTVLLPSSCLDPAKAVPNTALPSDTCDSICGPRGLVNCSVTAVDPTALSVTVSCQTFCGTGRRPEGFEAALVREASGLGGYFAQLTLLESASVEAFRILRDELRAHGAPNKLVRAAERAARDELRHTRAVGALARYFGARPCAAVVARRAPRSLAAIALENAVEGCVRETYGALQATFQAETAHDPVVRAVMRRIARDETKHAALSFRVARWVEPRLDRASRRRIEDAKQAAIREIGAAPGSSATSVATVLGLPGATAVVHLVREMERVLWS